MEATQCPSIGEWIRKLWYMYTMATTKEWNITVSNSLDGPRGYYAKWSRSDRERQMPYDFTDMWNLKTKINE